MSKSLTISLTIITFILGLCTGFIISPEYSTKMESRQTQMVALGNADKFVDLRYIDNMAAHHLVAIDLAQQAQTQSIRPEVKALAQDIITADEASITELYQWKKEWYKNDRKIINYQKINLGQYDTNFDLRLINALIAHHDEAIMSALEIRTKTLRNEILNLADAVIQNLTGSKAQLLEWRKNWYNI